MESEFNWWFFVQPFAGVVLGGSISLASTLYMQNRAQKIEATKKERESRKSAGVRTFVGLMKLVRTFESIENQARHLDEQLKVAISEGKGNNEPFDIYKAIIGAPHEFETLTAEEVLFLAKGEGELIARLGEIQQRARNNEVIAREYSNARRSLDGFMLQHVSQTSAVDGSILKMDIDQALKTKVDILQGQLNQMIIPLIIALEEDRKAIPKIIDDYIQAARTEFGDDFPTKGLELRKNQKHAHP